MYFELTHQLSLKLLVREDAPNLFGLVDKNRCYLREWLAWLDHNKSVQDSESFILSLHRQFKNKQGLACGVFIENTLVGMCGYHPINLLNQSVTVGYWLDKNYQGRGIITQCSQFFIDYAFKELGLNKVLIPVAVGNAKSRAVCERLGLRNEGIDRQAENLYGKYVDLVRYSILRTEWQEARTHL